MQPFLGNAIENLQVSVASTLRVGHGSDIFAQIIKDGVHPLTIAGARGNDGLIQRLTGDKAASHAARAWIGGNPVSEAGTHREFKQGRKKQEAPISLLVTTPTSTTLPRCAPPR